jgi:hypothetical protein
LVETWNEMFDHVVLKLYMSVGSDWTFDEDDLEEAISTTFGYDDRTIRKYRDVLVEMRAIEMRPDGDYRLNMEHPKIRSLGLDEII